MSDGSPYPVDLPGNFSAPTLEQLKPFGYAPGAYQMKCPACKGMAYDVDKRALRCGHCAINAFRAHEARKLEAHSEPYRTIDERCEILAAEMTDAGKHDAATVLYEAESRIRDLERDYHLMCEEDRRLQACILEIIAICDQDARDQDHNGKGTGWGPGSKAYAEGRGTACRGIATRLRALLPETP